MVGDNACVSVLGSTGCQPVVVGSPADNIFAHAIRFDTIFPVSASCRDLQAGSLRSPEILLFVNPRAQMLIYPPAIRENG
jgi:hypothetical protein